MSRPNEWMNEKSVVYKTLLEKSLFKNFYFLCKNNVLLSSKSKYISQCSQIHISFALNMDGTCNTAVVMQSDSHSTMLQKYYVFVEKLIVVCKRKSIRFDSSLIRKIIFAWFAKRKYDDRKCSIIFICKWFVEMSFSIETPFTQSLETSIAKCKKYELWFLFSLRFLPYHPCFSGSHCSHRCCLGIKAARKIHTTWSIVVQFFFFPTSVMHSHSPNNTQHDSFSSQCCIPISISFFSLDFPSRFLFHYLRIICAHILLTLCHHIKRKTCKMNGRSSVKEVAFTHLNKIIF